LNISFLLFRWGGFFSGQPCRNLPVPGFPGVFPPLCPSLFLGCQRRGRFFLHLIPVRHIKPSDKVEVNIHILFPPPGRFVGLVDDYLFNKIKKEFDCGAEKTK
jgi:hypothetical protein